MRFYLLRVSLIIILVAYSIISYGQTPNHTSTMNNYNEPLYLLNSNIIVNGLFEYLNPRDFKSIVVYKGSNGPSQLSGISSFGIINIFYDKEVASIPLSEISIKQQLSGSVVFIINGNKLNAIQSASLRIVPEAIGQLRVIHPTANNLETIIYIEIVAPKKHNQNAFRSGNEHRVMIR